MLRGGLCGFRGARIDDDDVGLAFVAHDPLPEDGMGDAKVRADENDDIAFLEIRIGGGRGIKTEGLLVSGDGGGHALAGVGIAVEKAHAEFPQAAEKGHFLEGDLTGGEKGGGLAPVGLMDRLEFFREGANRGGPIAGNELTRGIAQQGRGGTIGRIERIQCLPTFGAGHAEVHRIAGLGTEVDGFALFIEMDFQLATCGTVTADGDRGGSGLETRGHFAQSEVARRLNEIAGERAGVLFENAVEHGIGSICESSRHFGRLHGLEKELAFEDFCGQEEGESGERMNKRGRHDEQGTDNAGDEDGAEWSELETGAVLIRRPCGG